MDILSEKTALADLGPHLDSFVKMVEGAWTDYRTEYSDRHRSIWTPTTRAGVVHDHLIARASEYADITGGAVRLAPLGKLRVLVVNERYSIRMKKLNSALMPANWLTDQVRDFRRQQPLEGLPPTYHLDMGYVLDRAERNISLVGLAYPNGEYKNFWGVNLTTRTSMTVQQVLDFTRATADEVEDEEAVVITPKSDVVPLRRKE